MIYISQIAYFIYVYMYPLEVLKSYTINTSLNSLCKITMNHANIIKFLRYTFGEFAKFIIRRVYN